MASCGIQAATCIYDDDESPRKWRSHEPALTQTCKQFRQDVLPIYYSENIFQFTEPNYEYDSEGPVRNVWPSTVDAWLDAIGDMASHIVRVGDRISIHKVPEDRKTRPRECDAVAEFSEDRTVVEFRFQQEVEGQLRSELHQAKLLYDFWTTKKGYRPLACAIYLCRGYLAGAHDLN